MPHVRTESDRGRVPCLAQSKQEIIDSAGSHFDSSRGMIQFAREYSTFSPSVQALSEPRFSRLDRLAFVGTPCQVNAIRKMQAMDIVPSDSIKFCFGLFCSGNFFFNDKLFINIEKKYQFKYKDVKKINIKDDFIFSLFSGQQIHIQLNELSSVKRPACNFCDDFSAEYADISFGGIGAESGWTTAITRTSLGRTIFASALEKVLVSYKIDDNPKYATLAEEKIFTASRYKKELAQQNTSNRKAQNFKVIS